MPLRWVLVCVALLLPLHPPAAAQDEPEPVFGTTVVLPFGLRGEIYALKPWTNEVPSPSKLKHLGTIYTSQLNVKARAFAQGFPGVTDRIEWFAIDYTGHFYIAQPGVYEFMLTSDDGSDLFIDGDKIINNEGLHTPLSKLGSVNLAGGIHRIRVPYFQGPRFDLALQLSVRTPGGALWRPFSTDEFKPPPHPEDWKFGSPDDLTRDQQTPAKPNKRKGLFSR